MKIAPLLLAPILAAASPLNQRAERPEGSIDALFRGVREIYFGTATEFARLSEGGIKTSSRQILAK
jgi:hypothetical protein